MAAEQVKLNVGSCPSLETIGAFLDGRFKDREREIVAEHLASCESCYFVFTEAARANAAREAVPVPAPQPMVWTRAIVPALGLAATLFLVVNIYTRYGVDTNAVALGELAAAMGTQRVVEPRMTGGFAYGPVIGTRRALQNGRPPLSPDARIVIARLERDYAGRPAAQAYGTAALLSGDADRAITSLEAAARDRSNDARVLSDLEAAYLVRAELTGSDKNAALALAVADRAIAADRLLPEALFNRALALERVQRAEDARAAWQAFLAIDNTSGWADEARAHLRILSGQP